MFSLVSLFILVALLQAFPRGPHHSTLSQPPLIHRRYKLSPYLYRRELLKKASLMSRTSPEYLEDGRHDVGLSTEGGGLLLVTNAIISISPVQAGPPTHQLIHKLERVKDQALPSSHDEQQ